MTIKTTYDYAIIGAGVAGLNLAMEMLEEPFFSDKNILIIDAGMGIDKTLCFWDNEKSRWDDALTHSWNNGHFISNLQQIDLGFEEHRYKMLTLSKVREHASLKLKTSPNFSWIKDSIQELVSEPSYVRLLGRNEEYKANHVFDSRVEMKEKLRSRSIELKQHFLGWEIEIQEDMEENKIWNTSEFTMMDFRIKWNNSTSFTYVLPFSNKRALVEFTLFNHEVLKQEEYEEHLKRYISEVLGIKEYTVLQTEKGIIPMSTYPFHKHHTKQITKIGTAGGWVKPSTGYSFKNSMKYSRDIVQNILAGKLPSKGIACGRHRYYDQLFLDQLNRNNAKGEALFNVMYTKNDVERIFRFLDEETSFIEDLKVMATFDPLPFMLSIWKTSKLMR